MFSVLYFKFIIDRIYYLIYTFCTYTILPTNELDDVEQIKIY